MVWAVIYRPTEMEPKVTLLGIAKVAAALDPLMLETLQADVIISTGSSRLYQREVGDIVVSDEAII